MTNCSSILPFLSIVETCRVQTVSGVPPLDLDRMTVRQGGLGMRQGGLGSSWYGTMFVLCLCTTYVMTILAMGGPGGQHAKFMIMYIEFPLKMFPLVTSIGWCMIIWVLEHSFYYCLAALESLSTAHFVTPFWPFWPANKVVLS
jgi:hypothetical protein